MKTGNFFYKMKMEMPRAHFTLQFGVIVVILSLSDISFLNTLTIEISVSSLRPSKPRQELFMKLRKGCD